jgi:hypothetical protein
MSKRCHTCERKFGLIRYSYGFKQFCRKKCLQKYKEGSKLELCRRRGWFYLWARGADSGASVGRP